MATNFARTSPSGNRLLDRLPPSEYQRLLLHLKPVKLPFKQVIFQMRDPISFVYFPTSGVASAVATVGDGRTVEVATIGDEGMVGLSAILGDATSPYQVLMQVGGTGLRMPASALAYERIHSTPLHNTLVLYHSAFLVQISQSIACNGLHTVKQRCCRWLLMTHEFLAVMLGVRRASVTDVLRPLQEQGLVRSAAGEITVLDREGLEECSCECYRIVADEYLRLLS